MAKTKEEDFQEEELPDGSVRISGLDPTPEEEEILAELPKEQDEPILEDEDDDEESEDSSDEDGSIQAKREARRQERKAKKLARQKELQESKQLRELVTEQQRRIDELSKKTAEGEQFLIQKEVESLNNTIEYARKVRLQAMKDEDWSKVEEAERVIENVTKNKLMHEFRLQNISQEPQQPKTDTRTSPRQEGDPVAHALAKNWALHNSHWFDPNGTDADSIAAKEEDARLAAEGNLPNEPEYWVELDRRLRKRIPHRYNGGQQRTPHIGGVSQNRSMGKNETIVPKEYIAAMKEAGLWDNKEKRVKALAQYRLRQAKDKLER